MKVKVKDKKTYPFPKVTCIGSSGELTFTQSIANISAMTRKYDGMRLDYLLITFKFDNIEQFQWAIDNLPELKRFLEVTKYCFRSPDIQG